MRQTQYRWLLHSCIWSKMAQTSPWTRTSCQQRCIHLVSWQQTRCSRTCTAWQLALQPDC